MEFPERVYTQEEVDRARELIHQGYKHDLAIEGSQQFKQRIQKAIHLIKKADYYDFLRTYIRQILEIEGFSQLHEADAAIWGNMSMLTDIVDAASYIVQKAQQMKDYLEGNLYYGIGEAVAIEKRLEFIGALKEKTDDDEIRDRCEQLLKEWADTKIQFP